MAAIVGIRAVVSIALVLVVAGCGSDLPLGHVEGQVSYQGQPVSGAKIVFQPETGPAAHGLLDEQGRYTLTTVEPGDGAVAGKHRVAIVPRMSGVQLSPDGPASEGIRPPQVAIPARYHAAETSGLTVEVEAGGSVIDFELER